MPFDGPFLLGENEKTNLLCNPFLSEGEETGTEESESEEEVVEEGVTVKRKKKHRRKSENFK